MNSVTTYAPGRAEVLGNHTDYNEGLVLAIAVDRGTTMTGRSARDRPSASTRANSATVEIGAGPARRGKRRALVALHARRGRSIPPQRTADRRIRGGDLQRPAAGRGPEQQRGAGKRDRPFPGQGLRRETRADCRWRGLSQKAEHDFVGVRCGLLDQIASLMSKAEHATFIDFRTVEVGTRAAERKGQRHPGQLQHEARSGRRRVQRASLRLRGGGARAGRALLRDATTEMLQVAPRARWPTAFIAARCISRARTSGCSRARRRLRQGELARFGKLMYASHESSRVNFENSCPEIDMLVDAAREDARRLRRAPQRRRLRRRDHQPGGKGPRRGSRRAPDHGPAAGRMPRHHSGRRRARLRREPLISTDDGN